MRTTRLLATLLVLVAAPFASGHPGDEFEVLTAQAGDLTVYVTPQTPVVKAGRDLVLVGEGSVLRDGLHWPATNATWGLDARGPGNATVLVEPYAQGFAARLNLTAPGAWTLVVRANETEVELPLLVYPASAVRVESNALRYGIHYAERPVEATLLFVDDASGATLRENVTAQVRIERWENGTKRDEVVVPLLPGGSAGELRVEHRFPAPGSYELRVASAEHGIGFEDLPPFRLSVLPAQAAAEDEEPRREAPGAAALATLLAAVLAIGLRRRA